MKRTTAVAAVVGAATGLGLGITGVASAVGGGPDHPKRPHPFFEHPGDARAHLGHRPAGVVLKVDGSTLTLGGPGGTRTVELTPATTYFTGKDAATKAVLHVGTSVFVETKDGVAKSVRVLPAHVDGLVTRIDGTTVTIVDREGFTRTVHAAHLSGVKVGDFAGAEGTVDADGTTLDADDVRVLVFKLHPEPRHS